MREILLATSNAGKAREMRQIVNGTNAEAFKKVRWRFLDEFEPWPPPVEDGETFLANARIKARHYARLSGLWTIADDSGLEVDALGGEPGVRSARYAGTPGNDARNNALMIERLAGVPRSQRSARFRCSVVLADKDRILASADGTVEGEIVDEPAGTNGFGYDPHFYIESAGKTAAEMNPEQKNAISHRGKALRELARQLIPLLDNETIDQTR